MSHVNICLLCTWICEFVDQKIQEKPKALSYLIVKANNNGLPWAKGLTWQQRDVFRESAMGFFCILVHMYPYSKHTLNKLISSPGSDPNQITCEYCRLFKNELL